MPSHLPWKQWWHYNPHDGTRLSLTVKCSWYSNRWILKSLTNILDPILSACSRHFSPNSSQSLPSSLILHPYSLAQTLSSASQGFSPSPFLEILSVYQVPTQNLLLHCVFPSSQSQPEVHAIFIAFVTNLLQMSLCHLVSHIHCVVSINYPAHFSWSMIYLVLILFLLLSPIAPTTSPVI